MYPRFTNFEVKIAETRLDLSVIKGMILSGSVLNIHFSELPLGCPKNNDPNLVVNIWKIVTPRIHYLNSRNVLDHFKAQDMRYIEYSTVVAFKFSCMYLETDLKINDRSSAVKWLS